MERLHEQLDAEVAEYIKFARSKGQGLQVVLYVRENGELGRPRITIDTRREATSRVPASPSN